MTEFLVLPLLQPARGVGGVGGRGRRERGVPGRSTPSGGNMASPSRRPRKVHEPGDRMGRANRSEGRGNEIGRASQGAFLIDGDGNVEGGGHAR